MIQCQSVFSPDFQPECFFTFVFTALIFLLLPWILSISCVSRDDNSQTLLLSWWIWLTFSTEEKFMMVETDNLTECLLQEEHFMSSIHDSKEVSCSWCWLNLSSEFQCWDCYCRSSFTTWVSAYLGPFNYLMDDAMGMRPFRENNLDINIVWKRIFFMYVWPFILYDCETWTMT